MTHLPTGRRHVFGCYGWVDKRCNYARWLHLEEAPAAGTAGAAADSKQAAGKRPQAGGGGSAEGSPAGGLRQREQGQDAQRWVRHAGGGKLPSPRPGYVRRDAAGSEGGEGDVMSPMIGARW